MESFKSTIIILLLVFGLLTPIAQAKTRSVTCSKVNKKCRKCEHTPIIDV